MIFSLDYQSNVSWVSFPSYILQTCENAMYFCASKLKKEIHLFSSYIFGIHVAITLIHSRASFKWAKSLQSNRLQVQDTDCILCDHRRVLWWSSVILISKNMTSGCLMWQIHNRELPGQIYKKTIRVHQQQGSHGLHRVTLVVKGPVTAAAHEVNSGKGPVSAR